MNPNTKIYMGNKQVLFIKKFPSIEGIQYLHAYFNTEDNILRYEIKFEKTEIIKKQGTLILGRYKGTKTPADISTAPYNVGISTEVEGLFTWDPDELIGTVVI